jgi:hypothetical protein
MNGAEYLQENEDYTDKSQRARERIAALHGTDEDAHGNCERRG